MKPCQAQPEGIRNLCRDIFGTDNPDELRRIARKAAEYDRMMNQGHPVNLRGAGRRQQFAQQDMDYLIELYHQGKKVTWLAEFFGISRQTIYNYLKSELRFEKDPAITMRMIFMDREKECTVIDVDFLHRRIYIRNKTRDILHRAFGVVEEPTWEDFEEFLKSRCFPVTRANLKLVLRDLGLQYYDPLQIIEKTQGRMAEDHQWIRVLYREEVLKQWK
ncbi:MAG: helix-turn-helix domain-containing protein [Eubacteriales bacterium]|nr:helix-turn-helix domain-containing protein [Eubacteriales bacterium]